MRASDRTAGKSHVMKNNEPSQYYISHFNGPHGPDGPLYGKMIGDLKKIQSAVSEWQLEEGSTNSESPSLLNHSDVIEKLGKIEAGIVHWQTMEEASKYADTQREWEDRQDELEALEVNQARAGRGLLFAKAMLATNQDVLWAALLLLHVNREKQAVQLLEECVDPVTTMPPVIGKCFARLGFPDEEAVREAMKPKESLPPGVVMGTRSPETFTSLHD